MSYETAPATKMLATHCAICSRPLLDAESVEIGIGPICRKNAGYGSMGDDVRVEANALIHKIACDQDGPEVIPAVTRLMELGLTGVVTAILGRVATVQIAADGDRLAVKAPYSVEAVNLLRNVPGRRWDKEHKVNTFPVSSKAALFVALKAAYPGAMAVGPKGLFILGEKFVAPAKVEEPVVDFSEHEETDGIYDPAMFGDTSKTYAMVSA